MRVLRLQDLADRCLALPVHARQRLLVYRRPGGGGLVVELDDVRLLRQREPGGPFASLAVLSASFTVPGPPVLGVKGTRVRLIRHRYNYPGIFKRTVISRSDNRVRKC
eukprot:768585-Hanusia_phi.AAC.2